MNILYYIPYITRNSGGVFQYSIKAIKSLISLNTNNHYYIYNFTNVSELYEEFSTYSNITLIPVNIAQESALHKFFRYLLKSLNNILYNTSLKFRFNEVSIIDKLLKKYKISIVYSPIQELPENLKIPCIVTMHDVQELHFPQYFTSEERLKRAGAYKYAIDNATAVVVSFEHVKSDIIKFFNKPEKNIYVCLVDMKDLWFEKFNNNDILELKEFNLPEKYILYPAATWQHKNHIRLLKALDLLKKEKIIVNLVCSGYKTNFFQKIANMIDELQLNDQVFFPGMVDDQLLYTLFKKCSGVVIPTLYEAGSFPLIESMIMGKEVICSNVTSLPDTINCSEFLFDPLNIDEIAKKIELLVFDKQFRKRNIMNSKKNISRFIENDFSQNIEKVFKKISDNA